MDQHPPPRTTGLQCVLHRDAPNRWSYYRQLHHVVPQAWQLAWWPDWNINKNFIGVAEMTREERRASSSLMTVWDTRTEACCPTGHMNVHYLLVLLMKWMRDHTAWRDGVTVTLADVRRAVDNVTAEIRFKGGVVPPSEMRMAAQAPIRWLEHGGSINLLLDQKKYGES